MTAKKNPKKKKSKLKDYTYLGCPLTANRSPWCFRLCSPDKKGNGRCGRLAPHSLKSRTQIAIESHKKKKTLAHLQKIKSMYLSAPLNTLYNPSISFKDKFAQIKIPFSNKLTDECGFIGPSILYKILHDASLLCVYQIEQTFILASSGFNLCFCQPSVKSDLVARARFMGAAGEGLMAEAVVTGPDGAEIARGTGSFLVTGIHLAKHPTYIS